MKKVVTGNAVEEGADKRGWFVGSFVDPEGSLQASKDVEIKWGIHPQGEERSSNAPTGGATTVSILIKGKFQLSFEETGEEIVMEKEGDYIMMYPNQPHHSKALEDSVILTVRWPSLSNKKN